MRRPDLSGERPAGDSPPAAREHRHTDRESAPGQPELRPDQISAREGHRDPDRSGERPDWLAARLARLAASLPSAPGYLAEGGSARPDSGTAEGLPGPGGPAARDHTAAPDRPAADGRVAGWGDTPGWPGGRVGGHDAGPGRSGEPGRFGPVTGGDGSWPTDGDRSGSAAGERAVPVGSDRGSGAAAGPGTDQGALDADLPGPDADLPGPDADLPRPEPDRAALGDDLPGRGDAGSGSPGPEGGAGDGRSAGSGGSEWLAGGSPRRAREAYLPWFMSGQAPEPWFSEDPGAAPG